MGPPPCETSRFGCDDGPVGKLTYLASCPGDLVPLRVEVGQGEGAFVGLSEGEAPQVHYGPQGGQHVFLGARVMDARLDLYDQVWVGFRILEGDACGGDDGDDGGAAGGGGGRCVTRGERSLLMGGRVPLRVVDGVVEEYGVLVVIEPLLPGGRLSVEVRVEDPCRREAVRRHEGVTP
jgi:hypothetical protein